MVEPDPWNVIDKNQENIHNCVTGDSSNESTANPSTFEDNFQPSVSNVSDNLPDSSEYIRALERKLSKLKNSSTILEQLKARREHCIENLLVGNIDLHDSTNGDEIHLNEDIGSNTRRDILRYIQPEQPINLGELVTIIHHDYLDTEQIEHIDSAQQPDDTN